MFDKSENLKKKRELEGIGIFGAFCLTYIFKRFLYIWELFYPLRKVFALFLLFDALKNKNESILTVLFLRWMSIWVRCLGDKVMGLGIASFLAWNLIILLFSKAEFVYYIYTYPFSRGVRNKVKKLKEKNQFFAYYMVLLASFTVYSGFLVYVIVPLLF